MKKQLMVILTGICALLVTSEAFAGGFYLPGRGVVPNGRAGAYVASGGQNLNSLWYNPANLAGIQSLQLTIDLSLINLSFDFDRAPRTLENGDVVNYGTASNEAPPKVDPQVLMGGRFFSDDLSWGAGIYAPYLSGHTFPEDGPQRYVLVDNDKSLLAFVHFALAWAVSDNFRVGAGVQWVPTKFSLVNVASGYTGLFGDPEDKDLDILAQIDLVSFTSFGANAGLWWKVAPMLEAGLAFQSPIVFSDDSATLTTRLPSSPVFNEAETEPGDGLAGSLSFPLVVRFGLRLVQETFDIEAAVVYEAWSVVDSIQATPQNIAVTGVPGLGSIPVGPLSIPLNWQDTISVRLGSDMQFTDSFTLRAGYGFETATVPDSNYSVFLADGQKHHIALGGSLKLGESWSLDATASVYIIPTREITNSEVTQINPTDEENKITIDVGNGTYSQTYMIGGIGFNYLF